MANILEEQIFVDVPPFSNLQPVGCCVCNWEFLSLDNLENSQILGLKIQAK